MSTRRPRIKAAANLAFASKRKSKSSVDASEPRKVEEEINSVENEEPVVVTNLNLEKQQIETPEEPQLAPICEPTPLYSPEIVDRPREGATLKPFQDAFKYPLNPEYKRPSAVVPIEENIASDFEDNILHMDLQKSPGFPMSPTKSRQRIRPTPIFGQRRNSFVGTSPSPHTEDAETNNTGISRQRSSNSTSSEASNSFLMRKVAAGNLGRIRTESGCSTISESRGSSRKNPNDDHRNATKRDYHRFNGKVPDKSALKMFDLIYYNPTTNPMEQRTPGAVQTAMDSEAAAAAESGESEKADDPNPVEASAMPVPQLKLGSNGEMMIDEKSLEIETTAELEARKVLANSSLIYHDENTGGEGFYKKHKRTKDWPPDETIKFYRCLQTIGTDFSLMITLFPNRTRRDLKLKFKKEERCNLNLVNKALLYPGEFNIEDLKSKLDAEDEKREEEERLWREIKSKDAKRIKKLKNAASSSVRVLASGDDIYQNENVTRAKLSKRKQKLNSTVVDSPRVDKRRMSRTRTTIVSLPPKSRSSNSTDDSSLFEREINEILDPSVVSGDTMDSMNAESADISEESLKLILSELANGTLAFVASEDPSNPDKTVNEIYLMCKETGQLNDTPLELPEEIIDAIHLMMTS